MTNTSTKLHLWNRIFLLLSGMFMLWTGLSGQPSGGPYGPVRQFYDLPDVSGRIYYVAPDGDERNRGNDPESPTTLQTAMAGVNSGDAIVMRGGTYRTGGLKFNQGITIQPYRDEQPVMKGTKVATEWRNLRNGLWVTSWTDLFPKAPDGWWNREINGKLTPMHRFNNDMVFIDGEFLQSAGWEGEVDAHSYYIDYDRKLVFIGTNPAGRLVEITAFDFAMIRTTGQVHGKVSDKIGPVIRGITFTQYAYRAMEIEGKFPIGLSDESNHGKDVVGSVIENCTFSFCSRVAAYLFGDRMVIRHCKVSDTSTEGLYIQSSNDALLEGNIFTRNNIERITGYYPAAVKIFNQCYRLTCRDNLIIDLPYSNGVWFDVGNVDGRFLNNWVQDVGFNKGEVRFRSVWPSQNGFMFEISKGAVCAGNVFVNCDHGILVLNSSRVEIYNNTLVNSMVCIARDQRSAEGDHFGWHPSTGPGVEERVDHLFVNNLLTGDRDFQRPLLMVWQPGFMCNRLPDPPLKEIDHNIYVLEPESSGIPVILWSPAANERCQAELDGPVDLNKLYAGFEANSKLFAGYSGPLFRNAWLGNYELMEDFPGSGSASELPEKIRDLLRMEGNQSMYPGAYPPR